MDQRLRSAGLVSLVSQSARQIGLCVPCLRYHPELGTVLSQLSAEAQPLPHPQDRAALLGWLHTQHLMAQRKENIRSCWVNKMHTHGDCPLFMGSVIDNCDPCTAGTDGTAHATLLGLKGWARSSGCPKRNTELLPGVAAELTAGVRGAWQTLWPLLSPWTRRGWLREPKCLQKDQQLLDMGSPCLISGSSAGTMCPQQRVSSNKQPLVEQTHLTYFGQPWSQGHPRATPCHCLDKQCPSER